MLRARARSQPGVPWEVQVKPGGRPAKGKPGLKDWRAVAPKETLAPPDQVPHRGYTIQIAPAPKPTPRPRVERLPRPKPERKRARAGEPPTQRTPKWAASLGWRPAPAVAPWARGGTNYETVLDNSRAWYYGAGNIEMGESGEEEEYSKGIQAFIDAGADDDPPTAGASPERTHASSPPLQSPFLQPPGKGGKNLGMQTGGKKGHSWQESKGPWGKGQTSLGGSGKQHPLMGNRQSWEQPSKLDILMEQMTVLMPSLVEMTGAYKQGLLTGGVLPDPSGIPLEQMGQAAEAHAEPAMIARTPVTYGPGQLARSGAAAARDAAVPYQQASGKGKDGKKAEDD